MKRILFLILGFVVFLQMTAFAEIQKSAASNNTEIRSNYFMQYEAETNGVSDKYYWNAVVLSSRSFNQMNAYEYRYLMLSAGPLNQDNKSKIIVFSKKNQPTLEIIKQGKSKVIPINKIDQIGTNYMWFRIKKDAFKETYDADSVYLVFPTENNSMKKFEIPKTIVNEWETVLSTDMKKLRAEIMNS